MRYDPKKHHRRSIRLRWWDYTLPGAYFVTICTHGGDCLFGGVVNGMMQLSTSGKIAQDEWLASSQIRREIRLDAFVVMPNHIHGIVWINHNVGAHGRAPLQGPHLRPPPKSLGSFIAGYKSMVTKRVNETRQTPGAPIWQRNYYEHIVRNETELNRIREYIRANPLGWHLDRENPQRRGTDEFDRWLEECARSTGI